MGPKRAYKQYSKEFKDEAVALVQEQGYSVPEAAKSLGITSNILWYFSLNQNKIKQVCFLNSF